jgi:hypothetical protein
MPACPQHLYAQNFKHLIALRLRPEVADIPFIKVRCNNDAAADGVHEVKPDRSD